MWSMVAGTWHDEHWSDAPGRGGRNMWSVPIFQMRDTTFASGIERKTNHVPLHHAGCFMAGVPLHLASASVKSLTEHHANGRSGSGEGNNAQLQLRSNGPKLKRTGLLGGANRRLQMSAWPWRCSSEGSGP